MKCNTYVLPLTRLPNLSQRGLIIYTLHVLRQGIFIGILEISNRGCFPTAITLPGLDEEIGTYLTEYLYENEVFPEQAAEVISDLEVLFKVEY